MAEVQIKTDLDAWKVSTDLTKQNVTTDLTEQNVTTEFGNNDQAAQDMQKVMDTMMNDPAVKEMMQDKDMQAVAQQMQDMQYGKDMQDMGWIIGAFVFWIFALSLALYVLTSWGLYKVAKKLNEPHPWMAWVPYLNIYTIVKVGWKPWIWVLYFIIWLLLFLIPGLIIMFIVALGLARRFGRWVGTAILTFLFPFIMYPYLGTRQEAIAPEHMWNAWSSSSMTFGNIGVTPLEPKAENEVKGEMTPQSEPTINSEMPVSWSPTSWNPETKI